MIGKLIRMGIASFILLMVCQVSIRAQETISPQKKKLIHELVVILEGHKTAESISSEMLKQLEVSLPNLILSTLSTQIEAAKLSEQERRVLKEVITEGAVRMLSKYRELLPQRVNFAAAIETISYSLYDKFFSENELQDLITFYKTPTGKKAVTVLPQLSVEAVQQAEAVLRDDIMKLSLEVFKGEDRKILEEYKRRLKR